MNPDNVKAEMFDLGKGEWRIVASYPYTRKGTISYYDITFIPEMSAYILIGGSEGFEGNYEHYPVSTIAMFHDGVWSNLGQLNTARAVSYCLFYVFKSF